MNDSNTIALVKSQPWFRRWFDSNYYHQLYGHRDEQEAAHFINALIGELQPSPGSSMLDVGCGAGRHCRQLALRGHTVTGIDLAASSIQEARRSETATLRFFRHDMRKPFGRSRFDYVFNFFTSFGYFKDHRENNMVVRNMAKALTPAGTMVMDYLNVRYVAARLVRHEIKEIDGVTYEISRWADENHFFKKIIIHDPRSAAAFENIEQVSKFTLADFKVMFALAGMRVTDVFGDYSLNSYDSRSSPRLIMVLKKTA